MQPDRCSSQEAFDINLLDPRALDTPDGLHTALRAVEAVCHRGEPEIAGMVEALSNRSYILEYIISGALTRALRSACITSIDCFAASAR